MLDVLNGEFLVKRHNIAIAVRLGCLQRRIVVGACRDSLLENRRVGGDASEPILLDELL